MILINHSVPFSTPPFSHLFIKPVLSSVLNNIYSVNILPASIAYLSSLVSLYCLYNSSNFLVTSKENIISSHSISAYYSPLLSITGIPFLVICSSLSI
jgi:hypothetical protein